MATEQAAQNVENWLAGARTSVVQALCTIDTDVDETSTVRQAAKISKTFEDGDLDENDGMLSSDVLDGQQWPDADGLINFQSKEQNGVGYGSAEE